MQDRDAWQLHWDDPEMMGGRECIQDWEEVPGRFKDVGKLRRHYKFKMLKCKLKKGELKKI